MAYSNLEGKNVVIIGGTAGIGLAAAKMAADQGAKVWAAGRSDVHIETAMRRPDRKAKKTRSRQAGSRQSSRAAAICFSPVLLSVPPPWVSELQGPDVRTSVGPR